MKKLKDKDYGALASKLLGTTANVYALARQMFQYEFTDDDFDRLLAQEGVFRCTVCNEWKRKAEMDGAVEGFCVPCVDEIDGIDGINEQ